MNDHSAGLLPFQNILNLTDFSACSDAAFTWATGLTRANSAKRSLLHVVVPETVTYMSKYPLGATLLAVRAMLSCAYLGIPGCSWRAD